MDPVAPTVIPSDSIISMSVIAFLQKVRNSLANVFLSSEMATFAQNIHRCAEEHDLTLPTYI